MQYKIYEPTFHSSKIISDTMIMSEEAEAAASAVNSGWLSHGPNCEKLEAELADKYKCNAYTCNTGTAAVHLGLIISGVTKGDEVIVPATTFVASANAVKYCGATPVFVDVDPYTWNIDPSKIKAAITNKTKAIMPCHLFGSPSDLDEIKNIIGRSGQKIAIVNDACEALGATYKGQELVEYGVSTYSLFGNKTITCGEGGFVLSKEPTIIPYYRGHCHDGEYAHGDVGYNYRMNNVSAAIARVQLKYLANMVAIKQAIFSMYNAMLDKRIAKQATLPYARHGYWMYAISVPNAKELKLDLAEFGIETRRCFKPLNRLVPYFDRNIHPVADALRYKVLCLPSHANLQAADIIYISNTINKLLYK